jgi:hypothetical protein
MKQLLIGTLLLIAALVTGCDLFSSQPSDQAPQDSPNSSEVNQVNATLPLPASTCQSRLGGKVSNSASVKPPENVAVEIAVGGKTLRAKTDKNGLYGFAGLCAGQYAVSITPPGGARKPDISKVSIDGANPAKLDLKY